MVSITRFENNPFLLPDRNKPWESIAAFNGCPVKVGDTYHIVYRALSLSRESSIGYATSSNGVQFGEHTQIIRSDFEWEKYGCEDPRIVHIDGTFYITYTALSTFPFSPPGIKLAIAKTKDFTTFEKHPTTTFNSKAMALFPEKINGKFAAILTAQTDMPPAKIGVALFDREEDIWSPTFWDTWYTNLSAHVIPLQRHANDHIEAGAPPVKTEKGWLFIYSYIRNYKSDKKIFGIEAALLDLNNPTKVIGHTQNPLMLPETAYERVGDVPNVTFPTGALVEGDTLHLYYGAADTTCCRASLSLSDLLTQLTTVGKVPTRVSTTKVNMIKSPTNPIISPVAERSWESKLTFNPAAIYEDGKVHILYRAMGEDDTSVVGYASSMDGLHIDERLPDPVYVPREDFEAKKNPGNSGCEDPRLTRIGDRIYMIYTAWDAQTTTKVAMTNISVDDFTAKRWNWTTPIIISDPKINDKDAVVFPEKINGKYYFLHRLDPDMWIDCVDDLEFASKPFFTGTIMMSPRTGKWDDLKIGVSCQPIKTDKGWLLIYHGVNSNDKFYRQGAVLLDLENPDYVLARLDEPILEPKTWYENNGLRPGTTFVCGAAVIHNDLFLYYGGADQFTAVATIPMETILSAFSYA